MTFEPFTEAATAMTRATLPADHPAATHPAHVEGPTAAQIADRMYAAGYRAAVAAMPDGPFAVRVARVLTEAGIRMGEALDRPGGLDAVRQALRRRVDAAIADRFDPEHIAALHAEADRPARADREA